jgi:hypothetical protein
MTEQRSLDRPILGDHWNATRRAGGGMMTCLSIAVRGLLVTASAVGIVAYLLLTNSRI